MEAIKGGHDDTCLFDPVSTVKGSDSVPLMLSAVADVPSCRSLKILMYLSRQPFIDSMLNSACVKGLRQLNEGHA